MCGGLRCGQHRYTGVSEVKEEETMAIGDMGEDSSRSGVIPSDTYPGCTFFGCRYVITRFD